jgi:hypothetical protein
MRFFFVSLLLLAASAQAQPTLTAATNNPVVGDTVALFWCNTSGVAPGPAGAGVTWDFHALTAIDTFYQTVVRCDSTPKCDSFPGSNIAMKQDMPGGTSYSYLFADATIIENLGGYATTGYYQYYTRPAVQAHYPVMYTSSYLDTSIGFVPPINNTMQIDSSIVDGYGTLILPSGTFTNVLRMHTFSVERDSVSGGGVSVTARESYGWSAPGFHFGLLSVGLDTSGGLHVANVLYTTGSGAPAALAIAKVNDNQLSLEINPNPASDVLNIKFTSMQQQNVTITLSDITGKIVGSIPANIHTGANIIQYPVADLPAGMYLLHLVSGANNITKKVVVGRY